MSELDFVHFGVFKMLQIETHALQNTTTALFN